MIISGGFNRALLRHPIIKQNKEKPSHQARFKNMINYDFLRNSTFNHVEQDN